MNRLELLIRKDFPEYEAVLSPSGTCAIYLALRAIAKKTGVGDVIVPSTVCPSVVFAVFWAGFTPRFCDVELDTFCMSSRTIKSVLNANTRAIIAVYLFGKALDIDPIIKISQGQKIALIEDVAQAIGGEKNGKFLGNQGDYTVLSFNDKKVLQGLSGGALLIRDPKETSQISQEYLDLPFRERHSTHLTAFRDLTMSYAALLRQKSYDPAFSLPRSLVEGFRDSYLIQNPVNIDAVEKTAINYERLNQERADRYSNYLLYAEHMDHRVKYVRFVSDEICWRLPVLLNSEAHQRPFVEWVRNQGGLISNHYFPTSVLFGNRSCENAETIGLKAINFFVDSKIKREIIPNICKRLASLEKIN